MKVAKRNIKLKRISGIHLMDETECPIRNLDFSGERMKFLFFFLVCLAVCIGLWIQTRI